jgi:hypothetical protein
MADTPFGLSFGQPSKYMGQSPLAEIGKAAKTGLMAYGLQKSGAVDWLNKQGLSQNKQGGWGFNAPAGSAPPVAPIASDGAAPAPVQPPQMGAPMANPMDAMPSTQAAPPVAPQIQMNPPPDIGNKILENDDSWQEGSVNPQSELDSLVLPQQTGYNQMLATGNEYQQTPGYGKLQKVASKMFG